MSSYKHAHPFPSSQHEQALDRSKNTTVDTTDKVPFGSTLPAEPRGPGDSPRQRRNRRVKGTEASEPFWPPAEPGRKSLATDSPEVVPKGFPLSPSAGALSPWAGPTSLGPPLSEKTFQGSECVPGIKLVFGRGAESPPTRRLPAAPRAVAGSLGLGWAGAASARPRLGMGGPPCSLGGSSAGDGPRKKGKGHFKLLFFGVV